MSLYRGPIEDGKDRQHPVADPDAGVMIPMTPVMWTYHNVPTWYELVGLSMVFPPTTIPTSGTDNG